MTLTKTASALHLKDLPNFSADTPLESVSSLLVECESSTQAHRSNYGDCCHLLCNETPYQNVAHLLNEVLQQDLTRFEFDCQLNRDVVALCPTCYAIFVIALNKVAHRVKKSHLLEIRCRLSQVSNSSLEPFLWRKTDCWLDILKYLHHDRKCKDPFYVGWLVGRGFMHNFQFMCPKTIEVGCRDHNLLNHAFNGLLRLFEKGAEWDEFAGTAVEYTALLVFYICAHLSEKRFGQAHVDLCRRQIRAFQRRFCEMESEDWMHPKSKRLCGLIRQFFFHTQNHKGLHKLIRWRNRAFSRKRRDERKCANQFCQKRRYHARTDRRHKFLKCERCNVAVYCSRHCAKCDWKHGTHKIYCNFYRKLMY